MKKFLSIAVFLTIISCNSSGKNGSSGDSTSDIKPAENVNGNIPDTTNSGPVTGSKSDSLKVDSTHIDSSSKKH